MTAARYTGSRVVRGTFDIVGIQLGLHLTETWRFSSSPGLPIFFSPLIVAERIPEYSLQYLRETYCGHGFGLKSLRTIAAFYLALTTRFFYSLPLTRQLHLAGMVTRGKGLSVRASQRTDLRSRKPAHQTGYSRSR